MKEADHTVESWVRSDDLDDLAGHTILSGDLRHLYHRWCEAQGLDAVTPKRFGMSLARLGFTPKRTQWGRYYWVPERPVLAAIATGLQIRDEIKQRPAKTRIKRNRPHVLYRFYSESGELLYVGITVNLAGRFAEHTRSKAWWNEVADINLERFDHRDDVLAAEREAIETEHPLHNVKMNSRRCDACGAQMTPQ